MAYCKPGFNSWTVVETCLFSTAFDVTYFQRNFNSIHDGDRLKACYLASDNTETVEKVTQFQKIFVLNFYLSNTL